MSGFPSSIAVPQSPPRGSEGEVLFHETFGDDPAAVRVSERKLILAALAETHFFPKQAAFVFDAGTLAANSKQWQQTLQLPMRFARSAYVKNLSGQPVWVFPGGTPGTFIAGTPGIWSGKVISVVASGSWEIVPIPDDLQQVTFAGVGAAASALVTMAITDGIWTPGQGTAT